VFDGIDSGSLVMKGGTTLALAIDPEIAGVLIQRAEAATATFGKR